MTQTTFNGNGHKRAVLYARVSGDDSKKDGRNLKSQLDMGREYATAKERDYRIVDELPEDDKGACGASFELPQLGKILAMAERKEFDVLIVREIDRLSRNLAKQLIVEESLKRNSVTVEYVLADYADSPEGNLQKHIKATIAEYEREKIKERMTRGRRNVVKGKRIMLHGNMPFGYRAVIEKRNGENMVTGIKIHEPEARIVRMVFDWYTEGDENGERLSSIKIAERLSEMSVPTWSDTNSTGWSHWKKTERGHWSNATILCMLHNEVYKGSWHYGKQKRDGTLNPREHWLHLEVPAIVALEQWAEAQKVCKQNITFGEKNVRYDYLMRYRVKCERGFSMQCMTVQAANKELYSYYATRGAKACARDHNCTLRGCLFRADVVDALVWDWLSEWFKDPADLRRKLEAYQADQDKINAPILALLQANDDLIAKNQEQLATVKRMCEAKIYTIEESIERKTRLDETRTSLESARGELQERLIGNLSNEAIETLIEFAYLMADGVAEASEFFEKRQQMINLLNVRCILKIEEGEKVCYASFILTEGVTRRLVLPKRGSVLSVATTDININSRNPQTKPIVISARLVLPNTRKRKPQADIGALFAQVPQPVTAEVIA